MGQIGNKYHTVMPIHFEQYNKKQIHAIIMHKAESLFKQSNLTQKEWKAVINLLVNQFITIERRIDRFCQYLAMLMPDINKTKSSQYNNLILKLYERITTSRHGTIDFMTTQSLLDAKKSERREPDLPYASKLLLLSAYLASFNTRVFNSEQFAAVQKKRTKVKKRAPKTRDEHSLMQKGPQAFTLRDLSGIFITLFIRNAPEKFNKDLRQIQDIRYQISNLISIQSKEGTLGDTKFSCNVDHGFAEYIARKSGIDNWDDYLESRRNK